MDQQLAEKNAWPFRKRIEYSFLNDDSDLPHLKIGYHDKDTFSLTSLFPNSSLNDFPSLTRITESRNAANAIFRTNWWKFVINLMTPQATIHTTLLSTVRSMKLRKVEKNDDNSVNQSL